MNVLHVKLTQADGQHLNLPEDIRLHGSLRQRDDYQSSPVQKMEPAQSSLLDMKG